MFMTCIIYLDKKICIVLYRRCYKIKFPGHVTDYKKRYKSGAKKKFMKP